MALSEAKSEAKSQPSSPRALNELSRTLPNATSPKASATSPKPSATSPKASATSPKANATSPKPSAPTNPPPANEDIDFTLFSWVTNTYSVLHSPLTILTIAGLLISGSFIEIAPRKSLEFLDNVVGRSLFFVLPFLIAVLIDWPTGLLAATVSLIIFARLQKEDTSEGFSDKNENSDNSTKFISSPNRWFIERILGETPIAISSDRVSTTNTNDNDIRTSSSSMASHSMPADSSSSSSHK